jgi:DamX protein
MAEEKKQSNFITPELTHRSELILHLLEYSDKLVVVKGEPDSGKSTFFEELIRKNESNLIIRNLTGSPLTNTNDIFQALIDDDKHDAVQEPTYSQVELNQWLTRCQNKQQIPALFIDDADLFDDVLLGTLLNILDASNEAAVLHVCIFCEPSFLERLEESEINKKDSDSLHIIEMPGLSEKQAEQYIHRNYPSEGSTDFKLFDEKTIKQIHRISHGLPGRINALCEQYLNDPAKKPEAIEEKKKPSLNINIKEIALKNKSVLIVVTLLMSLSISVAMILNQTDKEDVKQSIKLELPKLNEDEVNNDDIVKVEVPEDMEPEPVTIEELSPSVIAEIADDLNNKTEVLVFNAQGNLIAKESDLEIIKIKEELKEEKIVEQKIVEEIIKDSVPFSKSIPDKEIIPEPEPEINSEPIVISEPEPESEAGSESVKVIEPKPEPKVEEKSEAIKKDIKWLKKQDPKKYVLQLIGAYEQETIDVYLKAFKNNDDKIISFTALNKGKKWHVLIYGLYANRDQAVAAIDSLPTKAKLMAPWPRSVQSIKDLL